MFLTDSHNRRKLFLSSSILNCYMNVVYTNSTFKRCAQTSISCRRFSDINQIQCTRWSACSFPSCTYSCTLDKSFKMFPARQSTLYLTSIKANMYVGKLLKFHKEIFFSPQPHKRQNLLTKQYMYLHNLLK